ncbi:AraC family transcriptional regulator [Paenibacillus eucommiae]|uniref:AraC-like DNA-binding protein n=1 Tax=Paenibacillus eucommiae TaxID=1355755 RepID=A0ABS4JB28_9BACL|nr:AraC family transcriptional regulator [Paenibacillus eucommiae]MBP1997047.1 AraC-like DNA-binding protein [Paenibacillus eucommiae]
MKINIRAYHYRIVIILLLVAMPPFLVASVYSMNVFLKQTIDLVNSKNENELVRTGNFMEQTFEQIVDGVLAGMTNEPFTKMQFIVEKLQIIKSLNRAVNDNKYLDQVMLYNEDEDYLLVSNYGIISDPQNSPYNWIKSELKGMDNYQIKVTETRSLNVQGHNKYVISLLAKLPLRGQQSYLNYTVDLEKLYNDFLLRLNVDNGIYNYYLTDAAGRVVFHKDRELLGTYLPQSPTALKLKDQPVISSYPLKTMGWNLVSEVNIHRLSSDVYKARNQMIMFLTLITLVIVVMTILGARQLYKPVRHLRLRLHDSEQLLKRTLVYNLIKERFTESADIERYLDDYHRDLVVVILTIHSQTDMTTKDSSLTNEIEKSLGVKFEIDLFVESDKQYVLLLKLDHDDMNRFITDMLASFNDQILQNLTLSIGGIYPLKKINNSYIEALYAFNVGRIYSTDTNIYCYSKLPVDYQQKQMKDPTIDELELAIRQHNEKAYTDLINTMLSENRSVMEYNYNLYMNISLLIKLYDQESVKFLSEINELITDKGIMNAAAVKHFFISKFNNFNADYQQDFNKYVQKVEQYIAECYPNNFSMDDVAEHVGLTRQYISQLFKKHYNTTLIDYLSQYRIEQAKLLLADTKMKINDVGSKVGFNSKSYFTKVFKLHTGITPTEYRELAWNRNKEAESESLIPLNGDG